MSLLSPTDTQETLHRTSLSDSKKVNSIAMMYCKKAKVNYMSCSKKYNVLSTAYFILRSMYLIQTRYNLTPSQGEGEVYCFFCILHCVLCHVLCTVYMYLI
jgi:hypothetical protein